MTVISDKKLLIIINISGYSLKIIFIIYSFLWSFIFFIFPIAPEK